MIRRLTLARSAAFLALLGGSYAVADRGDGTNTRIGKATDNDAIIEILSGVDFVPEEQIIETVFGETAIDDLINIARDPDEDAGLRIRAYRALALYPGDATVAELRRSINAHSDDGLVALASTGTDTILLRASMSSLAVIARAEAVDDISPMLNHKSRDVRAAAARALAVCGSLAAVNDLRVRLINETEPQVEWAIEEAIRVLMGDGSADQ